ncbi:unnamed protein product [Urochloa humidicola]
MPRVGHSSPASHRHCSPVLTTARRRTATCFPLNLIVSPPISFAWKPLRSTWCMRSAEHQEQREAPPGST